MFSDSLIAIFDPKPESENAAREALESTFWTRPDGHIQTQHFRSFRPAAYTPHTHSEYNLVICLEGAVSKTQMGITEVIEPGEAFMGNFGVEHSSSYLVGSKGCETVCLSVDQRVFTELLDGSPVLERGSPVFLGKIRSALLSTCALDIVRELDNRETGYEIVLAGLAMRTLVETVRLWPRSGIEQCEVDTTPRLPRRDFVRAYEFMRWCRKDAFRLEQLCRFLGTSEERFTRLFRTATNASPVNFYNRMLLERGRGLLLDPALSVKEISYQLGFRTSSHFVAAFHRQFGASPAAYRSRLQ